MFHYLNNLVIKMFFTGKILDKDQSLSDMWRVGFRPNNRENKWKKTLLSIEWIQEQSAYMIGNN